MLKLRFKAKAKDGKVKVPDFTPTHVFSPERFNQLSLNIELRRAYNRNPLLRPAKVLNLLSLPENVKVISNGFLIELEITV